MHNKVGFIMILAKHDVYNCELVIIFICTQLIHLIFIVLTKEDCICETKNKKKKILFIVA